MVTGPKALWGTEEPKLTSSIYPSSILNPGWLSNSPQSWKTTRSPLFFFCFFLFNAPWVQAAFGVSKSSRMMSERQATSLISVPIQLIKPNQSSLPPLLSLRQSLTFWKYAKSPSVLMSRAAVRPALQKLLHVTVACSLRHLPFLRNWLSSYCQVCLILSCLTRCYLESPLSGPLNPFVSHNNKKLGRRSLSGGKRIGGSLVHLAGRKERVHRCTETVASIWLFVSEDKCHF